MTSRTIDIRPHLLDPLVKTSRAKHVSARKHKRHANHEVTNLADKLRVITEDTALGNELLWEHSDSIIGATSWYGP